MRTFLALCVLSCLTSAQTGQFCLQTPPGLPSGNGQNGAMFDVQATGGAVLIRDFQQAFFSVPTVPVVMEVYKVTAGGSHVGLEGTGSAWTLVGTSAPITVTAASPTLYPLGLNLSELVPAGATQGFYVTSSTAGLATIAYTTATGSTPGSTVVASDSFISVLSGVGVPYAFGAFFSPRNWNGEICYDPGMGLFAGFSATPTSGPGPLTVQFTDTSYSSSTTGILAWAWDFGDGNTSTAQNPMHTYACSGSYTVSLLVQDGIFPSAIETRPGYVTVAASQFQLSTSGGGAGDLTVNPIPTGCGVAAGAASGWTLGSFATALPVGAGPLFGITPDGVTWSLFLQPAAVGNVSHFLVNGVAYPDAGPFIFPTGTFANFAGTSLDGIMVFLNPQGGLQWVSNVSRVTF